MPSNPLVQLGQMQQQLDERLGEVTATQEEELKDLWESAARQGVEEAERQRKLIRQTIPEQFMVLVMCRDEKQQVDFVGGVQA